MILPLSQSHFNHFWQLISIKICFVYLLEKFIKLYNLFFIMDKYKI